MSGGLPHLWDQIEKTIVQFADCFLCPFKLFLLIVRPNLMRLINQLKGHWPPSGSVDQVIVRGLAYAGGDFGALFCEIKDCKRGRVERRVGVLRLHKRRLGVPSPDADGGKTNIIMD